MAAGMTAAVVVLRSAMPDVLGGVYFVFYFPVIAAAAFFGAGPGLFATALAVVCVNLLLGNQPSFIGLGKPVALARGLIFLAGGIGISVVAGKCYSGQSAIRVRA